MSSLDLSGTQRWLAAAIMEGASIDEGITVAEGLFPGAGLENIVGPGARMGSRDRLGVYHHAYRARLVECLADDYPAVQYALGSPTFEQLCHRYIADHASSSFSLNFFGAKLPAFCRTRGEDWSPFAANLAALEWAIVEAIHAPWSARSAGFDQVPADGWNAKRLVPSATLRIVRSRYPVNAYYQAFREGRAPADRPPPAQAVTAVVRNDLAVWRMNVSPELVPVLDALLAGATLGNALETIRASEADVAAAFRDWMSTGLFVDIE